MRNYNLMILFITFFSGVLTAQTAPNEQLPDFDTINERNTEMFRFAAPDTEKLITEDMKNQQNGYSKTRYAVLVDVKKTLQNAGKWSKTADNKRIWRLSVESEKAEALRICFDELFIPPTAKLYVYSYDRKTVLGAFTRSDCRQDGKFAIAYIPGEHIVIEYHEPFSVKGKTRLSIDRIGYAYKNSKEYRKRGFGSANYCEVNINCAEGNGFQNVKNAVVRWTSNDGVYEYWCTGVLINNTANDFRPYILSAEHNICDNQGNLFDLTYSAYYVFDFHYEANNCENPDSESEIYYKTMIGADYRASSHDGGGDSGSDMLLLELYSNIPDSYEPYFAGWNRGDVVSEWAVCIHHPSGDVKKISRSGMTVSGSFEGITPDTHWKTSWEETQNGRGVTEPGSSGSPLFNKYGEVVGTLTGGSSTCYGNYNGDYFGKFSYHWNSNGDSIHYQLSHWLDPADNQPLILPGIDYSYQSMNKKYDKETQCHVFPNPAFKSITVSSKKSFSYLQITDISGRKVYEKHFSAMQYEYNLTVQNLLSGLYFISISDKKQFFGKIKFLKIN